MRGKNFRSGTSLSMKPKIKSDPGIENQAPYFWFTICQIWAAKSTKQLNTHPTQVRPDELHQEPEQMP